MCINAAQLQYAGCTGTGVAISVVQGQLVLYLDRFDADDVIEVFDPSGALPKNQDSWR